MTSAGTIAIIQDFPAHRALPWGFSHLARLVPSLARWWDHRGWFTFYEANPRSLSYMVEMAARTVPSTLATSPIDLVILGGADETVGADLPHPFDAVHRLDDGRSLVRWSDGRKVMTAILLYRDAIGIGWGQTEQALLGAGRELYAVNGRRRFFGVDAAMRRRLKVRRVLSVSRIPEIVFGAAVIVVGSVLALVDAARGRR